jgi:NAD(P)-dependent dehydrogenase (short-subunit alcohol dehydrogenase family)
VAPVAVVTGASRGLGAATARHLADLGYEVVLIGRSTEEHPHRLLPGTLEEVRSSIDARGGRCRTVVADLSTAQGVEHALTAMHDLRSSCRLLVNNAAYSVNFGAAVNSEPRKWQLAWDLNVMAPLLMMQALAPDIARAGGGGVVNISSGAAVRSVPGQTPYGATKAALERLTQDLAFDATHPGVRFNVLRIETAVPTEAYLLVSGSLGITEREKPLHSVDAVARAVGWIGTNAAANGEIFDIARLEALGALPEPTIRLGAES